MRRKLDEILNQAELRRADVVEAADRLTVAAGQPEIRRRGDAILREIRRRHGGIFGDGEVAVPGPEIGDIQGNRLVQFVLECRTRLPVVPPMPPPGQDVVCVTDRRRIVPAEIQVVDLPALAVRERVGQIAIGNIVLPARVAGRIQTVVPRPAGRVDRGVDRVQRRRDIDRLPGDIAADVHLECRLAIAEQIVGGTEPGIDVAPTRQASHLREIARRNERAGRQVGRGRVRVEIIVAQAEVEGQAPDGPLILSEQAQAGFQPLLLLLRRCILNERQRRAAQERVVHAAGRRLLEIPPPFHDLKAGPEVVRAGDIGNDESLIGLVG